MHHTLPGFKTALGQRGTPCFAVTLHSAECAKDNMQLVMGHRDVVAYTVHNLWGWHTWSVLMHLMPFLMLLIFSINSSAMAGN